MKINWYKLKALLYSKQYCKENSLKILGAKSKKSCMPVGTQKRKGFFSLTIWKVTMARDKTPLFYLSQAAFKYAQTLIDHRCIK
ncbi:hypothetical protein MGA3_12050 [Bacillus methanolicus MGA3]|nr:hypothetical protein MGA3_12050 [Bacillus methanolicus MGA3]